MSMNLVEKYAEKQRIGRDKMEKRRGKLIF
jgi:hypothetical protein